ncbi:glycoside hydrolase family 27 protein [Flexithrix dorotheae]|uniref:glycoside hydrolase family 27 protein n=1 Tax=Flexithrix dorotheae TaxID=70993 RepID=UPI00037B61CA|nr:glycoside hydrolase family 27 protein [Flexithrix dorotheae]
MNNRIFSNYLVGMLLLTFCACNHSVKYDQSLSPTTSEPSTYLNKVADTPPLGWNSFDAYDCRINEAEFKATVDFMAKHMKPLGWEYAVIDYIWWHPDPGNWNTPDNFTRRIGHPNIQFNEDGTLKHPEWVTVDEFGRLLPAVERFPSAKDGQGFKPIADYVHAKGLKFGIHIMRGVHRYVAEKNMPIKGTNIGASQIAEPWDTCKWNNNMFGVDPTKPGAQEYYNSLFELYASWGVDYIKADDMMFANYHAGEIEMIRKAIDNCGRPMVLSLSCGEAPLSQAKHLAENANMWRISADFWDEWDHLSHSFELLNAWSPWIKKHSWPDADMIPFGKISLQDRPHGEERLSKFTVPEQYTLMSLFAIARSPLMIGTDLISTPKETIETFFLNEEVLQINQASEDNRQVIRVPEEYAIWVAKDQHSEDRYLALFNLSEEKAEVTFDFELEYLRDSYEIKDIWAKKSLGVFENQFAVELPTHGAGLYRLIKK